MKIFSFDNTIPKEIFAKFWTPVINSVLVLNFILKFYQFGNDVYAFDLANGLIGVMLFAVVTVCVSYMSGSRSLGSYVRFMILYIAFVPHLKLTYLTRLADLSYTFGLRDHSFGGKWKGAIALWTSDVSEYLRILVHMMILMMGATIHDKLPKWYKILLLCAVLLALLLYVFEGTVNLFKYGISLIIVVIISDCWNKLRVADERAPQAMILWAELLLFAAMWVKGMTFIAG